MLIGNQIFYYSEDAAIRVAVKPDCTLWFVLRDICNVLDIEWKGRETFPEAKPTETAVMKLRTLVKHNYAMIRNNDIYHLMVNEVGLWRFLLNFEWDITIKAFTKFLIRDVFPAARQTEVPDMSGKPKNAKEYFSVFVKKNINKWREQKYVPISQFNRDYLDFCFRLDLEKEFILPRKDINIFLKEYCKKKHIPFEKSVRVCIDNKPGVKCKSFAMKVVEEVDPYDY